MDAIFVLTHDCNLGCSYCYAGRKFKKPMSKEVRDAGLALAFRGLDAGAAVDLAYFGGEPTLEWNLLVETATQARETAAARGIKLRQSVTTNGTLLTPERVRTLVDLDFYVALSIDGNQAAHEAHRPTMNGRSSFADVSRGLDLLLAGGKAFETISVLTPETAPLLGDSVEYLFERGVPRITVNPAYEAVWTDAAIAHWQDGLVHTAKVVARAFREGRIVSYSAFDAKIVARLKGGLEACDTCTLGDGSVAIAPGGNLYACERLVGEDEDPRHVIGHVERGIDAPKVRASRAQMPDHHATNDECGDCAERGRCGAYCACANLAETGNASIAGGVQCWHERINMEIADALYATLTGERNLSFAQWFALDLDRLPAPAAPVAAKRIATNKRRLAVVP